MLVGGDAHVHGKARVCMHCVVTVGMLHRYFFPGLRINCDRIDAVLRTSTVLYPMRALPRIVLARAERVQYRFAHVRRPAAY